MSSGPAPGKDPGSRPVPPVELKAGEAPRVERRRLRLPALVLLVDDEEDQRELYRQYLEYQGFRVELASNGFEALEKALALQPDVVVMDLAMPAIDGFEATRRLKLLKNTGQIPVIALTAHGELPREWATDAGCEAYLTKPAFPQELEAAILSVLARGG